MKRFLVLTAVAILTISASGCRMCDWLFRGSAVGTMQAPAPMYYEQAPQCAPCVPCDPCGSCGGVGAAAPMVITPGPESYAPAPIR